MCIPEVHILFLLIFVGIGSQRSTANPTPATTVPRAEPQNVSPEAIAANKSPDLNCQPVSAHTRQQIEQILEILGENDSELIIQTQMDSTEEAVLVLGETGVGKSSLIQFLIGNPELHSNKKENVSHYLINDDGEKIGSAGNYSFTQFPEIINFNGTNFIDTPGFGGSRSTADEIISTTTMKKIINKFKKVKILLLVDFSRGIPSSQSVDLMNTIKHLNEFIDVDRLLDHIALIFTKVPFAYRTITVLDDHGNVMLSKKKISADWVIKNFMMKDLNRLELNITDYLESKKLSKQEKKLYPKVIKFLQSIDVSVNSEGSLSRMNLDIFQHPDMLGSLNNMPFFESNRQSLYQTINDLEPLEIRQQDFNFTLSTEAELFLKCLKNLTTEDYKTKLTKMICMETNKPNEATSLKSYKKKWIDTIEEVDSLYNTLLNLGRNLEDSYYNELLNEVQEQVICPG